MCRFSVHFIQSETTQESTLKGIYVESQLTFGILNLFEHFVEDTWRIFLTSYNFERKYKITKKLFVFKGIIWNLFQSFGVFTVEYLKVFKVWCSIYFSRDNMHVKNMSE